MDEWPPCDPSRRFYSSTPCGRKGHSILRDAQRSAIYGAMIGALRLLN